MTAGRETRADAGLPGHIRRNDNAFDAVVMLTWSDWRSEPRSNRYHYATRLARRWPVYFVQPDGASGTISFEAVDGHDITLVHVPARFGVADAGRLARALQERGVTRPLAWLYNVTLRAAVARLHPAFVIYHATEDYVSPPDAVRIAERDVSADARAVVAGADLVIAVSEGVAASHRALLAPGKSLLVLENGCDFAFWDATGAAQYQPPPDGAKVALFQGGINGRLDYALLKRLSELKPDWQFWFCGKSVDGGPKWDALKARANVRDFGLLSSEGIANLARQSLVGLIPFKQSDLMRRSLPLKAYEYLACGLPVATIAVDALAHDPELFTVAETAEDFAAALQALAPTRTDAQALSRRRAAAAGASYDARFDQLTAALDAGLARQAALRPALNLMMLYDDRSTHVGTIAEHLEAFRTYSAHKVHFMPATGRPGIGAGGAPDLSAYDAVMIHYSVRVSVEAHLSPGVAAAVAAYRGPKLLFIQDEYDRVETSRSLMERLGINAVFTCVPLGEIDKVYPRARFPKVDFIPTLTGYVPEDPAIESFVTPMAERHLRIAYRGRALPHQYGALGREKYEIGVSMRRLADARGVPVDIEVDDSRRIYGLDWYRFIGSARATLGTESGANVFDMDGSLAALAGQHRDMPFDTFAEWFLKDHEGLVRMNQISPKIFEAIRLRTALVLFEGSYSGVVRAHEHYIPLAKDYSNVDEVFARLEDIALLEAMTERAWRDVIGTEAYSYRSFIAGVDDYVARRAGGRRRATIISVPMLAVYGENNADSLLSHGEDAALVSDTLLGPDLTREAMQRLGAAALLQQRSGIEVGPLDMDAAPPRRGLKGKVMAGARQAWRALPVGVRGQLLATARETMQENGVSRSWPSRLARPFWLALPAGLRARIASRIN